MTKKLILALLSLFLLIVSIGCSDEDPEISEEVINRLNLSEQRYTTYEDDYISFEHPEEWLVSGSRSADTNLVTIQGGSGYDFVIEAERINNLDTKKDFDTQITEEFAQGLEAAEEEDYITRVSYEDITIDGHQGKSLQLEIELLQGTSEILYQVLSEDLNQYDEIQNYISDHQDAKSFTQEITSNEDFQQGLQELIIDLEKENPDPEQTLSLARARLEHIQVYLAEDTSIRQRQKISIVVKENLVLRVYFFSDPEKYQGMIQPVKDLMDTIEFID